jgi:hypothetical protein
MVTFSYNWELDENWIVFIIRLFNKITTVRIKNDSLSYYQQKRQNRPTLIMILFLNTSCFRKMITVFWYSRQINQKCMLHINVALRDNIHSWWSVSNMSAGYQSYYNGMVLSKISFKIIGTLEWNYMCQLSDGEWDHR